MSVVTTIVLSFDICEECIESQTGFAQQAPLAQKRESLHKKSWVFIIGDPYILYRIFVFCILLIRGVCSWDTAAGSPPNNGRNGCRRVIEFTSIHATEFSRKGVLREPPLSIRDRSLHGSDNDQHNIAYRLLTLNRRPPTPQSRFLGVCMMFLGIIAAAIGTYHILTGRLWLLLLFWACTFALIHLGFDALFFGDGILSSVLP